MTVRAFLLVLKGKSGQPLKHKPVNNTRADKLDSFMWRYSFQERRCLIPVTEFAEAKAKRASSCPALPSLPGFDDRKRTTDAWAASRAAKSARCPTSGPRCTIRQMGTSNNPVI